MKRSILVCFGLIIGLMSPGLEVRAESSDAVSQIVGSISLVGLGLTSVSALTSEKEKDANSGAGQDFLSRYRADEIGFRKDVLRAQGPHYAWLINRDLRIIGANEARFRCLLLKEREKLKTLFERSRAGQIGPILDIRIYLTELAKQAQQPTAAECTIT